MIASDIMSSPVRSLPSSATVVDAANSLMEHGISALPILNEKDELAGIVTHSDFSLQPIRDPGMHGTLFELFGRIVVNERNIDHLSSDLSGMPITAIMASPVTTITEGTGIEEIVRIMHQRRMKRLPVVRGKTMVGIVTRHDFVRLVASTGAR